MKNKSTYFYIATVIVLLYACSPRNISTKYYEQNKTVLDNIEETYAGLYKQKHFNISFTDKAFETISIDIITDSLTYIYEFGVNENRLMDTLKKYGFDAPVTKTLIRQMRSIRCTWVTNFDYYVDGEKKSSVFVSIKPVGLSGTFSNKNYYIIAYFSQKQYYDRQGRLVNNRRQRQLQRVNGEIFKRINDKVSYTVSSTYR